MEPPKKSRPAAAKKPTSTLLDAYEVDCIRRELERLLKQNPGEGSDAAADLLGLRCRTSKNTISVKKAIPAAPPLAPPAKKLSDGGKWQHLGKHTVKLCSGAVSVSSAVENGRRPRRAGYGEVEKV